MKTRKTTIAAAGVVVLGGLIMSASSAASTEPPPEELSVIVGEPLTDDAIPDADRTPAVGYVDNPYVGDNFDPVEDEYGNPVYPTPVIVEPGH